MTSDTVMVPTDVHDPFFRVVTATGFSRGHIAGLASGRCAAVRVPGLFPPVGVRPRRTVPAGRGVRQLRCGTRPAHGDALRCRRQ